MPSPHPAVSSTGGADSSSVAVAAAAAAAAAAAGKGADSVMLPQTGDLTAPSLQQSASTAGTSTVPNSSQAEKLSQEDLSRYSENL